MRKMVEEKKKKRLAQEEGEGKKWAEPREKEVGPRGKWVEPHASPQIAQQCDSTGSISEGKGETCHQWCAVIIGLSSQRHHLLLSLNVH